MGETYIFLGWARGVFETSDTHEKRSFANIYVYAPVSTFSSPDYKAEGFKAEKKSCIDESVWKDIKVGEEVNLFFDSRGKVTLISSTGRSIVPNAK